MAIGRDFILAGKAVFTISGKSSRFTYRISRKDPDPGSRYTEPTYFVGLLAGPDNQSDYRYLGILDPVTGHVRLTKNSKAGLDAPSYRAINWALPLLFAGATMPPSFAIRHEWKCGRCGRALTVPESIDTGFGPECADLLGLEWAQKVAPAAMAAVERGDLFAVAFEEGR